MTTLIKRLFKGETLFDILGEDHLISQLFEPYGDWKERRDYISDEEMEILFGGPLTVHRPIPTAEYCEHFYDA